jgi:hypothetical protein
VVHDFNIVLSIILGYTELAMNRINVHGPQYGNLKEIKVYPEPPFNVRPGMQSKTNPGGLTCRRS